MGMYGTEDHPIIEALIDGTWQDISTRVRGEQKVVITRGRSSEAGRPTSQRANLTLENRDGFFSNRLPTSVNYGKIGKNTQIRVLAGQGDNYVALPYTDQTDLTEVRTADKASLDVTGDIDLRFEVWPHSWRANADMTVAAKYTTAGDQRSWLVEITKSGTIYMTWSNNGTLAGRIDIQSTAAVPVDAGRIGLRVTIDVDNGAGGKTVTFYTSDSIDGAWTLLGAPVIESGTTSVHGGTADITVGGASNSRGGLGANVGFGGKMYAFELRNGINGTVVARMDARTRAIGATSWSDGLTTPNTWTLAGPSVRVTSDRVRFWGELSNLRPTWDKTGTDVTIPATAYGLLRRLGQGAKPLSGPMYRNFTQYSPYLWWPLEDGFSATEAASAAANGNAAVVTAVSFGNADGLPGATGAMAFTDATSAFEGRLARSVTNTGVISLVFYVKMSTLPTTYKNFCVMTTTGSFRKIDIAISNVGWRVSFLGPTGTVLASMDTAIGTINPVNGWIGYNLLMETVGSDMRYSQRWDQVGVGLGGGTGPTTIVGQTVRPINFIRFMSVNDAAFNDMQVSNVFVSTQNLDLTNSNFRDASNGYRGETAAARIERLSAEEGVDVEIIGRHADSEAMGAQTTKTYLDLIGECWDADGGIGGEARDALRLYYRTRADLEAREDVVLTYSSSDLADVPRLADDDLGLTNDVTATRDGGSSARAVVETGPNSILAPPDGVGRYDTSVTLNVAYDESLPSIAGWLALVGTWDQDRYPSVIVALHRARLLADQDLADRVIAANLGDTLVLADLPEWMPPDDVPELIQGYTETLSRFLWEINWSATPAGPYRSVAVTDHSLFDARLDAEAHTIDGALTTTATSISLATPAGSARWVDSATYPDEFPMDIVIGGEVMTLTVVTGTASPQTGTVTRSVNGIVKSHDSGALVRLARPFYVGR